ncbi:MAG TPA: Rieske (2Fe-2S) protein [Bryobacteraceae bacterium]|nr:Rieske (2Fe-2S) protein [Bryobacteraceae bacterium]
MKWFRRPSNTPLWKDEFSVFTADERYVNRRQFTKFLTLTSLAMFAGNVWILLRSWFHKQPQFPLQAVARLDEIGVGGSKVFSYPTAQDPCILVRTAEDSYVAYSQKCTHLSCAVYYSRELNQLACPCHNGYFALADGAVLQGPPRRPLPRVVLEQKGGELVALRVETGGRA